MSYITELVERLRGLVVGSHKEAVTAWEAAAILEQVDALAGEWEAGRAPTAGAELRRALTPPKEER